MNIEDGSLKKGEKTKMNEKIGFARISINIDIDSQIDKLKKEGCKNIFFAKEYEKKEEEKYLLKAIDYMRRGDILVVTSLSRLHRSMRKGLSFLCHLEERGLNFKSIKEGIDTTEPGGIGAYLWAYRLSNWELETAKDNINVGLSEARKRGVRSGPKHIISTQKEVERMIEMHNDRRIDIKDILSEFKVTQRTLNAYLSKYRDKKLWFQENSKQENSK